MKFRPCIDLHDGQVKQIVGSTLTQESDPITNFSTTTCAADFARMYASDGLCGGHIIMLGPGNEEQALSAVNAFPGGMQVGGGITPENALQYLDAGASHVIVTSYVFRDGGISMENLENLVDTVGKSRLVLDLSCRKKILSNSEDPCYFIVTNKWQTFTDVQVSEDCLASLSQYCDEFLVHAVDVEGKRSGIQEDLVSLLGQWSTIPITYAGGVRDCNDLDLVFDLGSGQVDVSIGSALDIFGGSFSYREAVHWHNRKNTL